VLAEIPLLSVKLLRLVGIKVVVAALKLISELIIQPKIGLVKADIDKLKGVSIHTVEPVFELITPALKQFTEAFSITTLPPFAYAMPGSRMSQKNIRDRWPFSITSLFLLVVIKPLFGGFYAAVTIELQMCGLEILNFVQSNLSFWSTIFDKINDRPV
jgi:hypothetical protein